MTLLNLLIPSLPRWKKAIFCSALDNLGAAISEAAFAVLKGSMLLTKPLKKYRTLVKKHV